MLNVRAMKLKDVDRVYEIEMVSHQAPWSRDILRDCVLVGYDCRVLEYGEQANLNKAIVGYIICRYSSGICHILNLCVDTVSQGKGYGRFLLRNLLDSLVTYESLLLTLEVRPSNKAAIALYESFGFEHDTIKKSYYKDANGQVEDALVFRKIKPS